MVAWVATSKWLEIISQTGHQCTMPGVAGTPLATTRFDFSPLEFYLAAAVCSHMHPVVPSAASPEAEMIRTLVAHHVDDAKADFAIEASADGFKDYVKAYFSGTVATALAYIAMHRNGYAWAGHFEHLKPSTAKGKSPDFVLASPVHGTCLVESKGTRNNTKVTFDGIVEKGYLLQVERHLGTTLLSGALASHGYCVGAWMTSVSKAELLVHHSEAAPASGGGPSAGGTRGPVDDGAGSGIAAVQQQDMGTAFTLVFGDAYGEAVRGGRIDALPPLALIDWIDKEWITSLDLPAGIVIALPAEDDESPRRVVRVLLRGHTFAIERETLVAALGRYWQGGDSAARGRPLPAFDTDVLLVARVSGGAMLGNGLAIVPPQVLLPAVEVKWNPRRGDFQVA